MLHTHTCSEISYRITDVECIERAQTIQYSLTGENGWSIVKFSSKYAFYVLALKKVLMQQNSKKNKIPDCDNSAENETVLNDMPVLGLAGCHWR